ncbi:LamG-like jellyroll fold domain-containing protein [Micromonospora sp. NPDC049171]|uniref:LamG-like jellyroll fold domain-containing protein n=1 Tax=Micromonospora sp. NPDC049171 TaxID=3155770 RepID=UPI0033D6F8AC
MSKSIRLGVVGRAVATVAVFVLVAAAMTVPFPAPQGRAAATPLVAPPGPVRSTARPAPGAPSSWPAATASAATASAVRLGRRVEMPALRTPDRTVFANPDRTFTAELRAGTASADPTSPGQRQHWAMTSRELPSQVWWDIDDYHARVGHDPQESSYNMYHSYFQMDTAFFAGKTILENTAFSLNQLYSYSCYPQALQTHLTGPISPSTSWSNPPTEQRLLGTVRTGKGGGPECPGGTVEVDVRALMREAAANSWRQLTLGLTGDDQSISGAMAFDNKPVLAVQFNTVPETPVMTPTDSMSGCSGAGATAWVRTLGPVLAVEVAEDLASGSQGGGQQVTFEVQAPDGTPVHTSERLPEHIKTYQVPDWVLAEGGTYRWRATVNDQIDTGPPGPWCEFTVDTTGPTTVPTVTSVDFPSSGPGARVDRTGVFRFDADGDQDVVAFEYQLGGTDGYLTGRVTADRPGGSAVLRWTGQEPGGYELRVLAVDRADNLGWPQSYGFNLRSVPAPLVELPLDEGQGVIGRDVATRAPDGSVTFSGGASWQASGRHGGAVLLNGVEASYGRSTGPVVNTGQSFSVLAWVRLDQVGQDRVAVAQAGVAGNGFVLRYDSARRRWAFVLREADGTAAAERVAVANTAPQLGTWTHLAGVYDHDAGELRIYLNGRLAGSTSYRSTWNASGPLLVGQANGVSGGRGAWTGALDEVQLYDYPAAPKKIIEEMAGEPFGPEAWWHLNEPTGVVGTDASGNGHSLYLAPGAAFHREVRDGGVRLDGTSGVAYTAGPVVAGDASFTVSAWVRLAGAGRDAVAVGQDGQHTSRFRLRYEAATGRWAFRMDRVDEPGGSAATDAAVSSTASVDSWTHLTGVFDAAAGQLRLYVNGTLAGTASHVASWPATGALVLGRGLRDGSAADFWPGDVDEVRVLPRAVTAQEVPGLVGLPPAVTPGPVRIRAVHSGMCLTEQGGDSGYLYQQPSCGSQFPRMTLVAAGSDTYRITTDHEVYGPGCTGVQNGSVSVGAPLYDDYCATGRGQLFRVEPVAAPLWGYRLRPVHSNLCVGFRDNSAVAGAQLVQLACDSLARGQVFLFDSR